MPDAGGCGDRRGGFASRIRTRRRRDFRRTKSLKSDKIRPASWNARIRATVFSIAGLPTIENQHPGGSPDEAPVERVRQRAGSDESDVRVQQLSVQEFARSGAVGSCRAARFADKRLRLLP